MREPKAEGTVGILLGLLVILFLQHGNEEILWYWDIAWLLCFARSSILLPAQEITLAAHWVNSSTLYDKQGIRINLWSLGTKIFLHFIPCSTLVEIGILRLHVGHEESLFLLCQIELAVSRRADMTMVKALSCRSRVFCEICDSPLFFQVCIPWILALSLSRFPSVNVRCCVSCMESIAAPSLALHVVIPFCRIVQHTCCIIHVNDGIAGTIVLELWELQTADSVSYHLWHVGSSHILVCIVLIG